MPYSPVVVPRPQVPLLALLALRRNCGHRLTAQDAVEGRVALGSEESSRPPRWCLGTDRARQLLLRDVSIQAVMPEDKKLCTRA